MDKESTNNKFKKDLQGSYSAEDFLYMSIKAKIIDESNIQQDHYQDIPRDT